MIQRKPGNRLGYNGFAEVKEHVWLKNYPWKDLYYKKIESPFIPKNQENFDKKYCQNPDKIGNQTMERYQNMYKNDALSNVFNNYSFDNVISLHNYNANIKSTSNTTSQNINSTSNNSQTFSNQVKQLANNPPTSSSIPMNFNSTKKNVNNIPTNYGSNSFNKNGINNVFKNKMKPGELYLNNLNHNSSIISNINNSQLNKDNQSQMSFNIVNPNHIQQHERIYPGNLSAMKTPIQNKINPNNLNLLKTKHKINFSATNLSGKQINTRSLKISNDRTSEKLPLIDNRNTSKHMSSHSMINNSNFFNSPMKNHPISNLNKYSSISNNSTGSTSSFSMNFLHRRSGSNNY